MNIMKKIKVSACQKMTKEFVDELILHIADTGDECISDLLTAQIEGFLTARSKSIQSITVYRKPQKFWDWLLRRRQQFTINVTCIEVTSTADPAKTIMLYEAYEGINVI